YTAKPEGNKPLWNSYDNNFKDWSTPGLWQDDSYAYRFASVLQKDENVLSFAEKFWTEVQGKMWRLVNNQWELVDVPGIGPEGTRNMFALAMLLTHEPQYVGIYSSAGGGHAMIAYAVTRDALHVADPNYPGDINRTIYYSNDSFAPYASGDNWEEINAGRGKNYETIQYLAKSNLIPSEKIAQRWEEVKNGTIGNGIFPNYQIQYLDEDTGSYKTLAENQVFTKSKADFSASGDGSMSIRIYKNAEFLSFDSDWKTDLVAGDNLLGFHVMGNIDNKGEYVDFKYINVIYEPEEPEGERFQYSTSFDLFYDPNYHFSFNVNGIVLNVINPNVELKDYANSRTKLLRISNVSDDEQPTVSGSIAPNIPTHFIYTNFNGMLIEERTYTNPRLQLYSSSSGELLKTFTDLNFTWTADPGYTWNGTYEVRVVLVYNIEQKITKKEYVYNETTQENELVVKDISYSTEPENEIFRLDINVEKDASLHK
ncbi:MAG: hypothetical protein L3J79_09705, partial [Candidatus Marinimicrobia bacterium]|nr:hypothetical protein [Candidatus Neomarinimicrobiota bacterium]